LFSFARKNAHADVSSNHGGKDDEGREGDGLADTSPDMNSAIPAICDSSAVTTHKRKRLFGIFPA
jgi:hypothetical protein